VTTARGRGVVTVVATATAAAFASVPLGCGRTPTSPVATRTTEPSAATAAASAASAADPAHRRAAVGLALRPTTTTTTTTTTVATSAPAPSTTGSRPPAAPGPALGAAPPAAPASPQTQQPPSPSPSPCQGAPLRIMVVGDSVAQTLTASFAGATDRLCDHGVPALITGPIHGGAGWGLTADRPGQTVWDGGDETIQPWRYPTWRTDLLTWTAAERPDVVLVVAAGWDAIPRDGEDGVRYDPNANFAQWRAWYEPRVRDAARALASTGALVVWLRYPCVRSPLQTSRIGAVSDVIGAALATSGVRAAVLDLEAAVCPGGRFAESLVPPGGGAPTHVRLADGLHFDYFGAVPVVSPWLAGQLAATVGRR
jgi:hypothetical protein